ncbi:MAG: peptide ABC transporter substrate-binding protein [Chloroflexaceae bacterium]|nr:peptide ABC transporter substrate-binding protein [Chloroflexaceae bacterium]
MHYYRTCLCILLLFLSACTITGGVPTPTSLGQPTAPVATPTANERAATTPEREPTGSPVRSTATPEVIQFRIGLQTEPGDLLPYHRHSEDQRLTGLVSEMLFPTPLLPLNSAYTTTGVLTRVPSFANGDVITRVVMVDANGVITPTEGMTLTNRPTPTTAIGLQPVATAPLTIAQQLVITYRWNPDLTWSDGEPVTAADSVFAYQLAQGISLGEAADRSLQLLADYEQVDTHTTRAYLKPDFTDPAYMETFWTPLPRHMLADIAVSQLMTSEFAALPTGYGPYMIDQRQSGQLRLIPNPYYPEPVSAESATGDHQPSFITIVFEPDIAQLYESFQQGGLDVLMLYDLLPADMRMLTADEAARQQVIAIPNPIWEHLDFQLDLPLLQQTIIRRAIAHGFNRRALVNDLFDGQVPVLHSWVLPYQWAAADSADLTRYPYDVQQARDMLDTAGIIDTDGDGIRESNGVSLTFDLLTTADSPLRAEIARRLQQDMLAIGIAITITPLPLSVFYSPEGPLLRRQFELAQFAWISGLDPRGREIWSCEAIPSETHGWTGSNVAGWCFLPAHQAIIEATTALEQPIRQLAYERHQQLFTQELPVLPLFQRMDLVLAQPGMFGLEPQALAPLSWNITAWSRSSVPALTPSPSKPLTPGPSPTRGEGSHLKGLIPHQKAENPLPAPLSQIGRGVGGEGRKGTKIAPERNLLIPGAWYNDN